MSRERLERETGIEPATNGLGSRYSTIELLPLSARRVYRKTFSANATGRATGAGGADADTAQCDLFKRCEGSSPLRIKP